MTLLIAVSTAFGAQSAQDVGAVEDDGSYRMQVSAGIGRFTGKYGEEDKTTLDVLSLSARWYLPRTELQVSAPLLRIKGGADVRFIDGQPVAIDPEAGGDPDREESGLGDIVIRSEYYLRMGSRSSPWIIGLLRVKLPTGSEAKGLGSGATDVEGGLSFIQRVGPVSLMADAGYIFVGTSGDVDADNEVRLGGGASVPLGQAEQTSAYAYFENRTNRFDGADRRSISAGISTGLGQARRTRLSASAFVGLSDASEDLGLYVTAGRRF